MVEHISTNAPGVAEFFRDLANKLEAEKVTLLTEIGTLIVADVRHRIVSQADGTWERPSKWIRAKKATQKALLGTERYIKFKVGNGKLTVYGDMPGGWTFSEHEKGFVNKLADPREMRGNRVSLRIQDPAPLGLKHAGVFEFVAKKAGRTPARRIWSNAGEVQKIVNPVFPRWVKAAIMKSGTTVKATP